MKRTLFVLSILFFVGEGIFAIIKFKALTTEKNEISFEEITLVDSNLNKLEFQFIDGKIIVI